MLTRSSSGDEIANVNFLYDDIVHVPVLQDTIDSHISSATVDSQAWRHEIEICLNSGILHCSGLLDNNDRQFS